MRLSSSAILFAALLTLVTTACDKDKPKPDDTKKSEPTPVPSGLVFNDFLPTTGNATGLGVRDAGLEGGLAAVAAGTSEDPTADPNGGGAQPAAEKLKVTEPGSEPRAKRKYAFVANKTDKRVLTLTTTVSQSMGGQTAPAQEQTIKLSLDVTTKAVKPNGANLELKVTKVEIPGAPPQAAQMLAGLNGLAGTIDVSSTGETGEVQFQANAALKNQLAESVVRALNEVVDVLIVPFPDAPIGTGAKWEAGGAGAGGEQQSKKFSLKEAATDSATVDAEIYIKIPRRAQQAPRGGMMFVEAEGKGKYSYQLKMNQVAVKSEGEISVSEKIEVSDPKGGGGKQTVSQTQNRKHQVESVK